MTMKIEFKTDDAAFDGDAADEASRVISVDTSGNRIGHYAFKR
jgi:hypothetical protein